MNRTPVVLSLATWLQRRTAPRNTLLRCLEADLSEIACVDAGEHVELLHGIPSRGDMTVVAMTSRSAQRLGWFLLWDHFVWGTWFGLRTKIQHWALNKLIDAEQARVFDKWRKVSPGEEKVPQVSPYPRHKSSRR